MNTNPLFSTWESYQTSQACFQVVSGINQHQDTKSIDLEQKIERSKSDSEDLFVLLLWIKFEQFTRYYLLEKSKNKLYDTSSPINLTSSIFASFEKDEEFWNSIELLELLETTLSIPEDLIDKAQQISVFAYNILKKHQSKITVNDAYKILTKIVELMN